MSTEDIKLIISLIALAIAILGALATIVVAFARGKIKEFVKEKIAEAEEKYKDYPKPEKSELKLRYVLDAVKEKYAMADMVLNIKKFIELAVKFFNKMKGDK